MKMERITFTPELKICEQEILAKFEGEARIIDFERGYISAPWVNDLIEPRYMGYAADLIAQHFSNSGITKVAGIPEMGRELAGFVAERMHLPIAPSRKDAHRPGGWKRMFAVPNVPSFTTNAETTTLYFNGIERGDHVLFVDDFCAFGNTGLAVIQEVEAFQIKASYAAYCAKLFQRGFQRIQNSGAEAFYAIGADLSFGKKLTFRTFPK